MTDVLESVPELVPGYGWVVWPCRQLDEAAHRFVELHRPEPDTSWHGGRACLYCGRTWPCAELRWATARLNLPARTPPGAPARRAASPARHRLDRPRPFRRPIPPRHLAVAVLLVLCLVILVVPL